MERRCQDISREIQTLNKRQEIFKDTIEGMLRVQDRASERMQDQIIEEIMDFVHTKAEEALQLAVKDDCGCTKMKKKPKDCRESGNQGRMRRWLGLTGKRRQKWKKSEWRLEREGEAEVPDIIIVSDAVEALVSL